jgi:hypothetical protein
MTLCIIIKHIIEVYIYIYICISCSHCHCDQMLTRHNARRGMVYFGSLIWISVLSPCLYCFWSQVETEYRDNGSLWGRGLFTSWWSAAERPGTSGAMDLPQWLLPPAKPHLIELPEPLKIPPPAGREEADISHSNHSNVITDHSLILLNCWITVQHAFSQVYYIVTQFSKLLQQFILLPVEEFPILLPSPISRTVGFSPFLNLRSVSGILSRF